MFTIGLASQKGGVAKTSLAVNVAVAAAEAGHRVAILDADPQRSTGLWRTARDAAIEAGSPPGVLVASAIDLARRRDDMAAAGLELLVLDLPGRRGGPGPVGLDLCDLVVVPARPNIVDLTPAGETAATCRRLGRRFAYVISLARPGSSPRLVERVAAELIRGGIPVAPPVVYERAAVRTAFAAGLGITEFEPSGAAADEVHSLTHWIVSELEE